MTGRISKSISGLIGLGQEAIQHNKDKKEAAAPGAASDLPPAYSDIESDEDEDDWLADDVQAQLENQKSQDDPDSGEKAIDWFKKRHPAPPKSIASKGHLPGPVIIPQKRPDMRTRGFVRAYAPALHDCGVDQATFLDFLDGFHKDVSKHGWFNVTNIAIGLSVTAYTAAMAPSVILHFSAMAVHISIETGRRIYVSKKTNSYLDDMNEYYFQPRGLYAMIVSGGFKSSALSAYTNECSDEVQLEKQGAQ